MNTCYCATFTDAPTERSYSSLVITCPRASPDNPFILSQPTERRCHTDASVALLRCRHVSLSVQMKLWPRALPKKIRFHDLRHTAGVVATDGWDIDDRRATDPQAHRSKITSQCTATSSRATSRRGGPGAPWRGFNHHDEPQKFGAPVVQASETHPHLPACLFKRLF